MSSIDSTLAKGEQWERRIFYIPNIHELGKAYDQNEMAALCDLNDSIEEVFVLNTPLMWYQPTYEHFFHAFMIVRTKSGTYYSIEKNGKGIYIQRSNSKEDVQNYIEGEKRNRVTVIETAQASIPLKKIVDWIIRQELQKGYNVIDIKLNCQGFARNCFNEITGRQLYSEEIERLLTTSYKTLND